MARISPKVSAAHLKEIDAIITPMLRLAVTLCLCGRVQEALFIIAVVCSSWSAVNLHTSQRDILTPYGDWSRPSVAGANRMVARLVIDGQWFKCPPNMFTYRWEA